MTETLYAVWMRSLLDRHELTDYRLASMSGVPQPTIYRILKGITKNPKADTLRQIAAAVGETYSDDAIRITDNSIGEARDQDPTTRRFLGFIPINGFIEPDRSGIFPAVNPLIDCYIKASTDDLSAYALRVVGAGIEPRVRDHEYILFEPSRHPASADECLVSIADAGLRLAIRSPAASDRVRLDSVIPGGLPAFFPHSQILYCHPVAAIIRIAKILNA